MKRQGRYYAAHECPRAAHVLFTTLPCPPPKACCRAHLAVGAACVCPLLSLFPDPAYAHVCQAKSPARPLGYMVPTYMPATTHPPRSVGHFPLPPSPSPSLYPAALPHPAVLPVVHRVGV